MILAEKNFKLKGHESFHIREGWLRKGLKHVEQDDGFFGRDFTTDYLGVGSNMVKSIRYWLQATGLTEEVNKASKRYQYITEDFGKIINKFDPYFEDVFSLWLLHYKLVTNFNLATTWYLFFNEFKLDEFNKEDLFNTVKELLDKRTNDSYSEKSLKDDCNCLLKTYYTDDKENKNPEENTVCPFSHLELVDKVKDMYGKEIYIKKAPSVDKLNKLVVLYIIIDNMNSNSISIEEIFNGNCNAGKVLNLDRNMLNEYLDSLKYDGYIDINRTAGLDQVYINNISKEAIIEEYFKEI